MLPQRDLCDVPIAFSEPVLKIVAKQIYNVLPKVEKLRYKHFPSDHDVYTAFLEVLDALLLADKELKTVQVQSLDCACKKFLGEIVLL